MRGPPKPLVKPEKGLCPRCGKSRHSTTECTETRIDRVWPGRHVFKGRVRLPDGGFAEFTNLPLSKDEADAIMSEIGKAWARHAKDDGGETTNDVPAEQPENEM